MISVSAGYGTDGSSTPTIAAERVPSRTVFPITDGSLLSTVVQKRYVSTAAPAAFGPSSCGPSSRPSTGCSPITSKYDPPTTPARTSRGSPNPIMENPIVEKSPNALSVLTRASKSRISGTENVALSTPIPGALCRI